MPTVRPRWLADSTPGAKPNATYNNFVLVSGKGNELLIELAKGEGASLRVVRENSARTDRHPV